MTKSKTYSEWANLLERFGNGDDTVMEALRSSSFILDAGTALRFYLRVEEAYNKRKKSWIDAFYHSIRLQTLQKEEDFEILLRNAKQSLSHLNKFALLQGLPKDLQDTLCKDLQAFVGEIKKTLKEHISPTSKSKEKLLLLINSFSLYHFHEESQISKSQDCQNADTSPSAKGRKIIF